MVYECANLQTMGVHKINKLNQLHDLLGEGLLASTSWLEGHGYSRSLLAKYVAGGWLESPARGVYRRPGPPLKWQHVVASLQLLAGSFLHVGGRTALVHRGLGHYVRLGDPEPILLYGPETLPPWVNKLGLNERFFVRSDAMFSALRARRDEQGNPFDFQGKPLVRGGLQQMGLSEFTWGAWDWRLWYSCEERAILELLNELPGLLSFEEARLVMEGLATLRPALLQPLLEACSSIKVKRTFLYLAREAGHAWYARLDKSRLDLGKGKRMIVRGGRLDAEFMITVPVQGDDDAGLAGDPA